MVVAVSRYPGENAVAVRDWLPRRSYLFTRLGRLHLLVSNLGSCVDVYAPERLRHIVLVAAGSHRGQSARNIGLTVAVYALVQRVSILWFVKAGQPVWDLTITLNNLWPHL